MQFKMYRQFLIFVCYLTQKYLFKYYLLFILLTVLVFRERWSNVVCVLLSLLVLRVGCGMWLYIYLIIAFLFTLNRASDSNGKLKNG